MPIVASFTASKLLWLKRREPESWAKLAHVALPHDYLNWALTGSLVMEGSDASGIGLLDTSTRAWDAAACGLVDEAMLQKLPRLIAPEEWAGELQPSAAEELGLPAGVPVAAGGGDNPMSALGCGCASVGRVAVSLGTSGTVFGKTPSAARDTSGTVCGFLDATGGGLPLVCTLNCAAVPEEVRRSPQSPKPQRPATPALVTQPLGAGDTAHCTHTQPARAPAPRRGPRALVPRARRRRCVPGTGWAATRSRRSRRPSRRAATA